MIALRPLHGKFAGKLTWTVMEGREIPPQILKLLNVKKCKEDGVIGDSPGKKDKENKEVSDK